MFFHFLFFGALINKPFNLPYQQAFAELETDTPGTIFGITQKTDGKSNTSSSFDSTKTQGERDDDYEKHDRSGDEQYQADQYEKQRIFKTFGIFVVFLVAYMLLNNQNDNTTVLTDYAAQQRGIKTKEENQAIFKDA